MQLSESKSFPSLIPFLPPPQKKFFHFFLPPNRVFFMPLRYVVEKLRKETIEIQLNELTITTKRV